MRFSILGSLEAVGVDGPVALGGVKPRSVPAYLLLHANEPVARRAARRARGGARRGRLARPPARRLGHRQDAPGRGDGGRRKPAGLRRPLGERLGHAEHAVVKRGQRVKAGEVIGKAGFARAWHVHFMANAGGTTRGVGDRDPMPYVNYAMKRGH